MSDELLETVRLFSHEDDIPIEAKGVLIPRSIAIDEIVIEQDSAGNWWFRIRKVAKVAAVSVVSVAMVALVVFTSYTAVVGSNNVASVPSITILDSYDNNQTKLAPGPQEAFTQATFFNEVRDALIEENQTFLEVDTIQATVRYFVNGVLLKQNTMLASGEAGSWWDVPSGLYQVNDMQERYFSQYTQTYFPWTIVFEGNYMIHGVPEYPNGQPVGNDFVGGGIRLETAAAAALFAEVKKGTLVIVRAKHESPKDAFVYEPVGPAVTAPHYLVADIKAGAILAAAESDQVVPIASLTKLMTAIIAAEKMSLDKRVYVTAPTFVESLIPRLSERSSVSMYSLLQLLLVESSNEAAEVIAGEYGREEFIAAMNEKARAVGMLNTVFADPSGISAENVSTARDLFELIKYIFNKRSFILEITKTGEAAGVVGGGEFSDLINFNEVGELSSFIGGKIGETEAAGKTSISLHEVEIAGETRTLAVILLGSSARNEDIIALLDFVDTNYE